MTSTDAVDETPQRNPLKLIVVAAVLTALVVGAGVTAAQLRTNALNGPVTYRYVIEPGTTARADAGEAIEVMPAELDMLVGDRLVIENNDSADFVVGPYRVRGGETLDQTFKRPGWIIGECGLSATDDIRITIS